MKGIAIILTFCLLMLGAGNLRYAFLFPDQGMEMACSSACCHGDDKHNSENEACDEKEACDADHQCLPACDCCCQFQITATEYNYQEVPGITVQSFHYGNYRNSYTFEYTVRFLHPPRFS